MLAYIARSLVKLIAFFGVFEFFEILTVFSVGGEKYFLVPMGLSLGALVFFEVMGVIYASICKCKFVLATTCTSPFFLIGCGVLYMAFASWLGIYGGLNIFEGLICGVVLAIVPFLFNVFQVCDSGDLN